MTRHARAKVLAGTLLAATLVLAPPTIAATLGLRGTARSQRPIPAAVRVGVFAVERSGAPVQELASAPLGADGSFALTLPETAPPERAVGAIVPEGLDWPGLVGRVTLSNPARAARAVLRAYTDADGKGAFGPGDSLWETAVTRGTRGAVILVWTDGRVQVKAERGFDLTLERGWNLAIIEVSRTVSAQRAASADGLLLDIFRR